MTWKKEHQDTTEAEKESEPTAEEVAAQKQAVSEKGEDNTSSSDEVEEHEQPQEEQHPIKVTPQEMAAEIQKDAAEQLKQEAGVSEKPKKEVSVEQRGEVSRIDKVYEKIGHDNATLIKQIKKRQEDFKEIGENAIKRFKGPRGMKRR